MKKPWSIQIELVLGCNRRCDFCYRQVHEQDPIKVMTFETVRKVIKSIKDFDPVRLKFAMRGEPLLHPVFLEIIESFRYNMPKSKIIVTTNGDNLNPKFAQKFFEIGGNSILVDCYNGNQKQRFFLYRGYRFKKDLKVRVSLAEEAGERPYNMELNHEIILIEDIKRVKSDTRKLSNLAGNMTEEALTKYNLRQSKPLKEICTRPFGELVICQDGNITLCCHDGAEDFVLGNVYNENVAELWSENYILEMIRGELLKGDRSNRLCRKCNFFGGNPDRLRPLPEKTDHKSGDTR